VIANVFFITTILFLALFFFLLEECAFLIPYRDLLIGKYGAQIGLFASALFFNIFAGVYVATRKLFLKDTGRKLAHIEKQLRTGSSISAELSQRLSEEQQ
jgi:hypothetical protein